MQRIFRKDLVCITKTTTGKGRLVVFLSLVSDSPQAPVVVTLAAIPELGLRSTFSFADTGSPPEKFPS